MFDVLRKYPEFRKLWFAQLISQSGDWLSRMALLGLIGLHSNQAALGVGLLYGVEMAMRLLPTAFFGPLAGSLADRMSRRALMITSDVIRSVIVLGYLAIDSEGDLPLLYCLLLGQMSLGIFFESARAASIPNTLPREALHAAYALSAMTWSTVLALGSFAGGALVKLVGVDTVFIVDSLSYLVSAVFVVRMKLPPTPAQAEAFRWRDIVLFTEMRRAARHVRGLGIGAAIATKSLWGGAGGYLVMLSVVGSERFAGAGADPGTVGFVTGILFCARGVGTGLGPLLARRFFGSTDRALMRQILGGFTLAAIFYLGFAFSGSLALGFACVVVAHMGGSSLWVASTVLWQKRVDDAFRGRVFALEFFGMTLSFAIGGLIAGLLYDATGSIEETLVCTSAAVLVSGFLWWRLARGMRKRDDDLQERQVESVEGLDPS